MKITTILLYLLGAFLVLWWLGGLISTFYMTFFDPLVTKEEKRKGWKERLIGFGIINLLFWPQALPQFHAQRKFHNDLKTGKRPKWLVREDQEADYRDWTLSDGTEFEAMVLDTSTTNDCCILADYTNRRRPGDIQCRVRMTAPTEQPFSDWLLPKSYKPKLEDEDDSDDEDDEPPMRYAFYGRFDRGKYSVEFRVETKPDVFETCSQLTMIVSNPDDYE